MLYEDRLYGFAVAALSQVVAGDSLNLPWVATRAMDIAEAMEAEFTARLKARRDAADAQLQARRAELEAPRAMSPAERVAYVALGCAPVGSGDRGMY